MPEDKAGTRKVYRDHNLHVLFGVTLMAVLGVSSITPALPEIRDAFGVTSGQVGLLITVFGDIYAGRERSAALGYNSSVLSVGTASYPAIGGALAAFGWFYPFALAFLAIPIGLLVLFSLRNPEPRNEQRLKDYLGNVLSRLKDREVLGLLVASLLTFTIL